MKIIQHGNKFEFGPTTCYSCKCKFTFNKLEIHSSYNREDETNEYYLICPECGNNIYNEELNRILCDTLE